MKQIEESFLMSIHNIMITIHTFLDYCKFSDDSIQPYDGCIGFVEKERISKYEILMYPKKQVFLDLISCFSVVQILRSHRICRDVGIQ